jgi:hypothetical protein
MGEVWRRATRRDRVVFVGAAAFILLLVVGLVFRQPAHGKARQVVSTTGLEATLAAMQLHHRPEADNPLLRQFANDLDILEADCPSNTRRELAASTAEAVRVLGRDGVEVTPNAVLGGVVGQPDLGSTRRCDRFFALWVAQERADSLHDSG